MLRRNFDIKNTPRKYFDYSYEDNNEYRILTTNGLIRVSRLYYSVWNLIDGKCTYEDIMKEIDNRIMQDHSICNEADANKRSRGIFDFFEYLIEKKVIIANWTSFSET